MEDQTLAKLMELEEQIGTLIVQAETARSEFIGGYKDRLNHGLDLYREMIVSKSLKILSDSLREARTNAADAITYGKQIAAEDQGEPEL